MSAYYDGCGCVDCEEAEREDVGPHTCRFSSGECYPEHCTICRLAINDPKRHRFLQRVERKRVGNSILSFLWR